MKYLFIFFSLLYLSADSQNCDSLIVKYSYMSGPFQPTVYTGITADTIRNGKIIYSDGYHFTYDNLGKIISKFNSIDSITFAYDLNSKLSRTEYYRKNLGVWDYRTDTSVVEYFNSLHGLDSLYKYQWDGTSLNAFNRQRIFYNSGDSLFKKYVEIFDSSRWEIDTLSIITFTSPFPGTFRVDSVYNDTINQNPPDRVIRYDSLNRILFIQDYYFGFEDRYESFAYNCNQLSSYYNSCNGCHSGFQYFVQFDSLCRLTNTIQGYYSTSGSNTSDVVDYYYPDCSTLYTRAITDQKICKGDSILISAVAFGGSGGYTIQWSPSIGIKSDTSLITTASPDSSTYYIITVIDGNGLIASDTIYIQVSVPPIANITILSIDTNSVCQTAVLKTDSLPGYNFYWYKDSTYQSLGSTAHLNISQNITYYLSVSLTGTNYNVCPAAKDTFVFKDFSHPAPSISIRQGCDEIIATKSSAGYIQWFYNDQLIVDSLRDTLSVSLAGDYKAIAVDTSGCMSPLSAYIYYAPFSISLSKYASCQDSCNGSMSVQPTFRNSFLWSNGDTTDFTSHLCSGIYSVQVTDRFGCIYNKTDTIKNFPKANYTYLSSGTSTPSACDAFVIAVDTGNTPYTATYLWPDGTTDILKDSVCAGWNTVLVKPNFSRCPQIDSFFVTSHLSSDTCSILISKSDVTCYGSNNGKIQISSSTGSPFASFLYNTQFIPNLLSYQYVHPGSYPSFIIDKNGCIDSTIVNISEPQALNFTISTYHSICQDTCLTSALVTGGTPPYRYQWCNSSTAPQFFSCIPTCNLVIRDSNQCSLYKTFTQLSVSPITFTTSTTLPSCDTCSDGAIIIHATGGQTPYSYSLNSGSPLMSDTIRNIGIGTYKVCVIGADSCSVCHDQVFVSIDNLTIENHIAVYPNPTRDILYFFNSSFKSSIQTTLFIFDNTSKLTLEVPINKETTVIKCDNLSAGWYTYILRSEGGLLDRGKFILN